MSVRSPESRRQWAMARAPFFQHVEGEPDAFPSNDDALQKKGFKRSHKMAPKANAVTPGKFRDCYDTAQDQFSPAEGGKDFLPRVSPSILDEEGASHEDAITEEASCCEEEEASGDASVEASVVTGDDGVDDENAAPHANAYDALDHALELSRSLKNNAALEDLTNRPPATMGPTADSLVIERSRLSKYEVLNNIITLDAQCEQHANEARSERFKEYKAIANKLIDHQAAFDRARERRIALAELHHLKSKGVLTNEEYLKEKNRILVL